MKKQLCYSKKKKFSLLISLFLKLYELSEELKKLQKKE